MSKKNKSKEMCCCQEMCGCNNSGNGCCGSAFSGLNSCVSPIIFLLIACGSGVLRNNKSYLIILLFLLCGGCYSNLFGGSNNCSQPSCCQDNCCC